MLHSLRARFLPGVQDGETADDVDFNEAVDGDDFVLVDVCSKSEEGGTVPPPQDVSQHHSSGADGVITQQPTTAVASQGGHITANLTPAATNTSELSAEQQQAWAVRPMDVPFWLSSKLQALVSCQQLAQVASNDSGSLNLRSVGGLLDNRSLVAALESTELQYDFQLEKQVVAFGIHDAIGG